MSVEGEEGLCQRLLAGVVTIIDTAILVGTAPVAAVISFHVVELPVTVRRRLLPL